MILLYIWHEPYFIRRLRYLTDNESCCYEQIFLITQQTDAFSKRVEARGQTFTS